jgi:acetolactate synthase regulatory subunit
MGQITIDFRPSTDVVPTILERVHQLGFYLRSIRVVPSASSQVATLHLSLGGQDSSNDYVRLLNQLEQLDSVLGRIDLSPRVTARH